MTGDLLIGIDAGTSVLKSVAFTTDGRQIAVAGRPNAYDRLPGGGVEQDMHRTYRDVAATLRDLQEKVPDLAARTIALAVTAQGDGTWLVDDEGEPVGGGLLWLDSRAAGIAAAVAAAPDYRSLYETTGTGVAACQMPSQLAWLKRNQPERLARAALAFHAKDWLYACLTGVRAADPSEAVLAFGDIRTRAYAPALLGHFGLEDEARLLPPIVDGARQAHPLTAEAAALTGLSQGLPVVLAPIDIVCTALGAGLVGPGGAIGCSVVGSTGCHMTLAETADQVSLNPDGTGYTICLPAGSAFVQLQSNFAATLNIDWIVDLMRGVLAGEGLTRSRADILAGADARVLAARPAAALFHPYISEGGERGPFTDAAARASFTGLDDTVGIDELLRAVFEGLAFAARDCYAAIGGVPDVVHLAGGAIRSRALRSIFAAVLERPVRTVSQEEAGAAGAAMTAAVQQGLFPDMTACSQAWVAPLLRDAEPPDPALAGIYAPLVPVYRRTREVLRPVWSDLAAARRAFLQT